MLAAVFVGPADTEGRSVFGEHSSYKRTRLILGMINTPQSKFPEKVGPLVFLDYSKEIFFLFFQKPF